MIIGIIGLLLLAVGWIPETIKIIKEKRSRIDLRFGMLYVTGSFLLIIYSIQIRDYIFLVLNSFVMVMSAISLIFSEKKERQHARSSSR